MNDYVTPDKSNCHTCDLILEGLERVDDECDVYGIHMVKIQDPQLAKRYSIKTFPAMVYFRNGNPLLFEGKWTYTITARRREVRKVTLFIDVDLL